MKFEKVVFRLAILVVFFLSLIVSYFWLVSPVANNVDKQVFVVYQGESTKQIAERLEKKGLVRSRYLFIAEVYRMGLTGKIQAGSFRLSKEMSVSQIAKILTEGRLDQWLTIIEGLRREQVALLVEEKLSIGKDDFLLASRGKEGRLFPDTYLVPIGVSAEKLVSIMTNNFDVQIAKIENFQDNQYSQDQLVTIASLVEREAKKDGDRQLVAGIIKKRLENGWPLQIDASSQYAKATLVCQERDNCDWWPSIGSADLKVSSPYNTYLNIGLPPGPICNPSLSSLRAAANPIDSEYWFYVSDLSGKIHFSETYQEHKDNVSKYL